MIEENLQRSRGFDQWLLNALVETPINGRSSRLRFLCLRGARQLRLLASDPLVEFALGDCILRMPLSHELPLYRRLFPRYALNLGRVAYHLRQKYANLTMIDVGANIGDSVAIVRMYSDHAILCIEGEERFFQLLTENAGNLGDVELEQTFLGAKGDQVGTVHVDRGNARVMLSASRGKASMCTLSEAVSRHPRFAAAKLLKLDAEGFDCRIIASDEFLKGSKPTVFFEYYPTCCELTGQEPFPVFARLAGMGYVTLLIYQNVGRYLTRLNLNELKELLDLHRSLVDSQGFCDVVAFHQDDLDIAGKVQMEEVVGQAGKANELTKTGDA